MIAIIGAGISGLSLAHFLEKEGKEYMLFEKSKRVGGVIESKIKNGFVFDLGPNSVVVNDDVEELITDLNLQKEVREADPTSKNRFLIDKGEVHLLPSNPQGILKSGLLTFSSKFSVLREILGWYKKSKIEHETVDQFFKRHFTKEISDKLVYAFVNGIYSSNPEDLDIDITFPSLVELEGKYKSVLKGLMKEKSLGRLKTINFSRGLSTLTDAISEKIKNIQLNTEVTKIQKQGLKFELTYTKDDCEFRIVVDKVVFSCPAPVTGQLIRGVSRKLMNDFLEIQYGSINTVSTVYPKRKIKAPLSGFGALKSKNNEGIISGTIWSSNVFPYKSDNEHYLLVSMVKGEYSHEELLSKVDEEQRKMYEIDSYTVCSEVKQWKKSLPIYNKVLKKLQKKLYPLSKEGIFFHANWFGGISIKDCISKSRKISANL